MLQRRGEEEGRTRLSLTEGSDLFCFAAGWRPPTRRSAGLMLSLRSRTSFFPSSSPLSHSFSQPWRDERRSETDRTDGGRGMKEGRGMRDGSTRGAAPGADSGPVRARALSDEKKRGDSSVIMCMVLFSSYKFDTEFDTGRSRDRKVGTRNAPCALQGTICLMALGPARF